MDQDYAEYGKIYLGPVSRVKILMMHDNGTFAYRITKTKVLTAVMDTVHAIRLRAVGARIAIQSRSESVRQVEKSNVGP